MATKPFLFRKILQYILLISFGVTTTVATLEIFGRLLPLDSLPGSLPIIVQSMRLHSATFFQADPYFRYVMKPDADLTISHSDFSYRVKTKLHLGQVGFRGGTFGGAVWGMALGDSFTFGMGVQHESTWVAQLTALLRREIMNLGVPGWGPQQYTRALERFGPSLKPKVVLYALYRNDLQDAVLFDQWWREPRYQQAIETFLRIHSITFNLVRLLPANMEAGTEVTILDNLAPRFNAQSLKQALIESRAIFPSAWPIMRQEVERAIAYSRSLDATFVLLYFPSKEETYWELITRQDPSLKSQVNSIEMMRSHISDYCTERRIRCLDLTSILRVRTGEGIRVYYPHDTHWNEVGNRIVAEEIQNFFESQGILK